MQRLIHVDIIKVMHREFTKQYFSFAQKLVVEVNGINLDLTVKGVEIVDLKSLMNEGIFFVIFLSF